MRLLYAHSIDLGPACNQQPVTGLEHLSNTHSTAHSNCKLGCTASSGLLISTHAAQNPCARSPSEPKLAQNLNGETETPETQAAVEGGYARLQPSQVH